MSAVSRSVRNSALAPPRSSTQRTIERRVVGRVLSVAMRRATIREQPRMATKAKRSAVPSPSGRAPTSAQSPWVWMPGPVSKRRTGSPVVAGLEHDDPPAQAGVRARVPMGLAR